MSPSTRTPPPAFSASTVEQVCRVLGDAVIGPQIPNLIAPLMVIESSAEAMNAKWKRLFNAVAAAQNRQQYGLPFLRLVSEVMAPVRHAHGRRRYRTGGTTARLARPTSLASGVNAISKSPLGGCCLTPGK